MSKAATLISVHPDGQVVWGRTPPAGALVIASAARYRDARAAVQAAARHGRHGRRYFASGVPEAENEQQAMAAVLAWRDWLCKRDGLTPVDPTYVQQGGVR